MRSPHCQHLHARDGVTGSPQRSPAGAASLTLAVLILTVPLCTANTSSPHQKRQRNVHPRTYHHATSITPCYHHQGLPEAID
ncbi:hypothetical protein NHX12_032978 [Muraenolepis orangiensis]|uniref:Uncharacterized protein n=1 Tax=Muraenolepis orangiensis TaxID=630683 RepID=A0A9Q0E562_9TELE|nr:hypothetical protein NHX12_032978 [Muraenolepis orangiensis]